MLLENIFAAALWLFMIMVIIVWTPKDTRHDLIYVLFFGSGLTMIITAIMWIWRAWS